MIGTRGAKMIGTEVQQIMLALLLLLLPLSLSIKIIYHAMIGWFQMKLWMVI